MSTNKKNIHIIEWITQAEAARMKGVSRQAIHNLIKKGRLKTFAISSITFVSKEDIENFVRQKAGRPQKLNHGQTDTPNS